MSKLRIALLGFRHEAMLPCPFLTDESTTIVYRGAEITALPFTTITGVTERVAKDADLEVVPLIFARTLPGGAFERGVYEDFKAESLALLTEHGPFDAVLVANHGAAEVDGLGVHGDTDYVCAIRALVGPDIPLAVPFDMHGQVTPALLDALTCLSCLRTAPHRDNYETSWRATDQLIRCLKTGLRPKKAAVHVPIMAPGEKVMTAYSPTKELFGMLHDYDQLPGVVEAHLFVGFGWNDTIWCSMKTVVVTEDDEALALRLAQEIADKVWAAREGFQLYMETAEVREGLERAAAAEGKVIYLSDSGDNVTAGAGGDLTFVLQEAIDLGLQDIVVAGIFSQEIVAACHAAGTGATLSLELGHHVSAAPQPMTVSAVVEALGDKVDTFKYENLRESEAPWARVRIGGVIATFHAARMGFTGGGHMEAVGIDPLAHKMYVVKVGYAHPAQEDIMSRHICLISPGVADLDFRRLTYRNVARPFFPIDADMTWSSRQGVFTNNQHLLEA